jgi:hypothetical protein
VKLQGSSKVLFQYVAQSAVQAFVVTMLEISRYQTDSEIASELQAKQPVLTQLVEPVDEIVTVAAAASVEQVKAPVFDKPGL